MKELMKLIEKFILNPAGKIVPGVINHFKYRYSAYVVDFIATFIYVFTFHPILVTLEEMSPFSKHNGQSTTLSIEKNDDPIDSFEYFSSRLTLSSLPGKAGIYEEYLVEISNDKDNAHRVSVARFLYNIKTKDCAFSGINYMNHGQIYCRWNSISMFQNEDNSLIEYYYNCVYCDNSNNIKGRGKLYYSEIPKTFIMGSFNDDNGKEVYAQYYRLKDVEAKLHFTYNPKDPDNVRAFIKKITERY